MARRSILAAMATVAAVLLPASADAATAPTAAPQLTSPPYTLPVRFHWTPGSDPLNVSQSVYRDEGACTSPVSEGGLIITYQGNGTTDFTSTGNPPDGTYCYYIKSADLATTANSPGLTVRIDTHDPTATVAVAGQTAGVVSGIVSVSGTGADAVSGVASGILHVGAVGACPAGAPIPASWDTTAVPNGPYDVCNVVTDNAGHVAVAKVTVTVGNPLPPPAPPAPPPVTGVPAGTILGGPNVDTTAPQPPTRVSVVIPRAKAPAGAIRVTLRWVKPTANDLDRVAVVLNLRRPPRNPADGKRIYRGLGTSAAISLKAGQTGYVALFAYDHVGNVSKPARRVVSLASLIPLRPLSGSIVSATPHLTWKPKAGSAYYNVQLFRNGRRVLVGWPSKAAFDVPPGELLPGTYVWFVWPALKAGGAAPTFADRIGRATFVVKA